METQRLAANGCQCVRHLDTQLAMLPRSCVCGEIHPGGVPCPLAVERHKQWLARQEQFRQRPSREDRGYGYEWRKLSKRVIARDGRLCRLQLPGCTVVATTTDHIIPKKHGGSDDLSNLQAACRHCNGVKRASVSL